MLWPPGQARRVLNTQYFELPRWRLQMKKLRPNKGRDPRQGGLLLAKDFLVLSSCLSLSPDQGFVLAHCAAPSLGLSFPQHTERTGPNHGRTLLPLTILDSRFQRPGPFSKEKGLT